MKTFVAFLNRGNPSHRCVSWLWPAVLVLLTAQVLLAAQNLTTFTPGNQRKALVLGRGDPYRDQGGGMTHAQGAKNNFLRLAGNPQNDPAKGWTCDMSYDLMVSLGMDPAKTSMETLFNYIGQHHLGYRIVILNGPSSAGSEFWGAAVDNGMMPFAPQGDNNPGMRFDDPYGIRVAVGVAGGSRVNSSSYGPGVEMIDALPTWMTATGAEDAAQSWANQAVAVRFARILDAHPNYNIWDARQHLRQSCSFWASGWNEKNGYGRPDERAAVGSLQPAPPVEFRAALSRDKHRVIFTWRNFLQSDFAATVIARQDGRIIYEGTGTNCVWTSDLRGSESFTYWSRNQARQKSRIESYQARTVAGLTTGPYQTCLVLGAPPADDSLNAQLCQQFEKAATNWSCDIVFRPGNNYYDRVTSFPSGQVVAVLPDFTAMVSYAISNHYRILIAPVTYSEGDLYRYKADWDRATAAGILVVLPHHASVARSRAPQARRLSPPRLFSAITVGGGITNNLLSFGPGLEVFDAPPDPNAAFSGLSQTLAAAAVAGKLAQILDANPTYNVWDARQHLRQSASLYTAGWREDGGFGRPPAHPAKLDRLEPAPPVEIQAAKTADGKGATLSWQNFLQSNYAQTVIQRGDGRVIYEGTGTNFTWRCDLTGEETFRFFTKDKSGRVSRPEVCAVLTVTNLRAN